VPLNGSHIISFNWIEAPRDPKKIKTYNVCKKMAQEMAEALRCQAAQEKPQIISSTVHSSSEDEQEESATANGWTSSTEELDEQAIDGYLAPKTESGGKKEERRVSKIKAMTAQTQSRLKSTSQAAASSQKALTQKRSPAAGPTAAAGNVDSSTATPSISEVDCPWVLESEYQVIFRELMARKQITMTKISDFKRLLEAFLNNNRAQDGSRRIAKIGTFSSQKNYAVTDEGIRIANGCSLFVVTTEGKYARLNYHEPHGAKGGHSEKYIPAGFFDDYRGLFKELGLNEHTVFAEPEA